jgi:hypothetical protein
MDLVGTGSVEDDERASSASRNVPHAGPDLSGEGARVGAIEEGVEYGALTVLVCDAVCVGEALDSAEDGSRRYCCLTGRGAEKRWRSRKRDEQTGRYVTWPWPNR